MKDDGSRREELALVDWQSPENGEGEQVRFQVRGDVECRLDQSSGRDTDQFWGS